MTIIEAIKKARCALIIGHQRPDGDCLGAGLTLCNLCDKLGVRVDFLCDSEKPQHYGFLPDFGRLNEKLYSNYDLLFTVDCADNYRMGKFNGYLKSVPVTFNIDHHKTNNRFAKYNIVVSDASSTCEIIYDSIRDSGLLDSTVAMLLYVGLSTDTGHFMHTNTTSRVMQVASELLSYGIDANRIATLIYKHDTISKTMLTARAINSMRFFKDNKICVITVRQNDLEETGCSIADTEGLIDYAMKIGCVEVGICLTEQVRPHFKVSYRSKSVDVASAAATFGGGGHTLAAGCVISGKYEDVIDKLLKSVTDEMKG